MSDTESDEEGEDIPHPSLNLRNINGSVHEELVSRLDTQSRWTQLAQMVQTSCNNARELLLGLGNAGITVGELSAALENLGFVEPLALLKPREPLKFTSAPPKGPVAVHLGTPLQLSCLAEGFPPPKYQWYHNETALPDQTNPTLTIDCIDSENEGNYHCRVEHIISGGTVLDSPKTKVSVVPEAPTIIRQPKSCIVAEGTRLEVCCVAKGHPSPTYEWIKDNTILQGNGGSRYVVESASLRDTGMYKCVVVNTPGEVYTNLARVTVTPEIDANVPKVRSKVALLIGNQEYTSLKRLVHPVNDVCSFAEALTNLGFQVAAFSNLDLDGMRNVIDMFIKHLVVGGSYVVFYFAGHGLGAHSSRLLPVEYDDQTNSKNPEEASEEAGPVSDLEVMSQIMRTNPELCLCIVDVCRNNTDSYKSENIYNEAYSTNRNFVCIHATSPHKMAYERRKDQNGCLMKYVLNHMDEEDVMSLFSNVSRDMEKDESAPVRENQMPTIQTNASIGKFRLKDKCTVAKIPKQQEAFTILRSLPQDKGWTLKVEGQTGELQIRYAFYKGVVLNSVVVQVDVSQLPSGISLVHLECTSEGIDPSKCKPEMVGPIMTLSVPSVHLLKGDLKITLTLRDRSGRACKEVITCGPIGINRRKALAALL